MPSSTQEWPVLSQTHQFSYTIPYTFANDANGLADIRLNYRLQALVEGDRVPALAPRLPLVRHAGIEVNGPAISNDLTKRQIRFVSDTAITEPFLFVVRG